VNDAAPPDLPALRFAETARRLAAATHGLGLAAPAFRCPPKVAGADRTIRRYPGGAVVAVRLRGRAFEDAVVDMVEGVLVANRVPADDAGELRAKLADSLAAPAPARVEQRAAA
jgi:hypothetical protein